MLRSSERILTTHVGSLPRPMHLAELLTRRNRGEDYDREAIEAETADAVVDIVARQVAAGVDIVSDGEMGKPSYATYIQERLTGFGEVDVGTVPPERLLDRETFPEYYEERTSSRETSRRRLACVGPVGLQDSEPLRQDLDRLRRAVSKSTPVAAFMTAASPGVVARFHPNVHYSNYDEYRAAIGAAMRQEYEAIVEAGFLLQLDCPDLAGSRTNVFAGLTDEEFVRESETSIEILNDSLRNIPRENVRLHLCWGNYEGPHVHDIALSTILPTVLKADVGYVSFEGANPRHEHEWAVWREVHVPGDLVLMPGVIDSTTNYVEHPQLVAQRIAHYADIVGREQVIGSVDCGFETFIGASDVHPTVVYAKVAALAEGARIASSALWS